MKMIRKIKCLLGFHEYKYLESFENLNESTTKMYQCIHCGMMCTLNNKRFFRKLEHGIFEMEK